MFEDEQKLRLIAAAAKLQNIIATLKVDLEYQSLTDFYGSGVNVLTDEAQDLLPDGEFEDAGEGILVNRDGDHNVLFTTLNQTVTDIGKLVDLH